MSVLHHVFTLLFSLTLAALALLIGSLYRTRERSAQLLLGTAMPLLFVSGLSWPVQALPPLLQALRWVSPSTAGIKGLVALNQLGASLYEVRIELAVLAVSLLVFGAAGLGCWLRPPGAAGKPAKH